VETDRVSAVIWLKAEMTPASTSVEAIPVISVEPVIWATMELMVGLGVLPPPPPETVVGERDGRRVGVKEIEGETVGATDGVKDGWKVGRKVGMAEGEKVGARVYEQKGFSEEYRVFFSVSVIEYPSTARPDTNEIGLGVVQSLRSQTLEEAEES
jgi:hypothetical protein